MQRLYSSFARGAPGAGLFLMRLTAGTCLAAYAFAPWASGPPSLSSAIAAVALASGLLLIVGLWTPAAGVVSAIVAGWHGFFSPDSAGFDALLGMLGVALTLLGPGAWSVDSRLFGRKRLEIRNGTRNGTSTSRPDDSSSA